eukprot:GAFH01006342.1.p4 GENE.GAFH01006342.1~~GAFH01006342.1.p4  ORF type:complete len:59 (-),score=5.76 GAFH01006342.1:46-222(-)
MRQSFAGSLEIAAEYFIKLTLFEPICETGCLGMAESAESNITLSLGDPKAIRKRLSMT